MTAPTPPPAEMPLPKVDGWCPRDSGCVLPTGHGGDCDLTAAIDPTPSPATVRADPIAGARIAAASSAYELAPVVIWSYLGAMVKAYDELAGAGRVGSGEPAEEAPMSLVEREESTLAGRLGMARARYEGAQIAVHEAEREGRDIHAQQPRRKPPKGSLGAELAELRAYRANAEQHVTDVRDELRRQVDTQERRAVRAEQERDDYKAARRRALVLHCWTNEDGLMMTGDRVEAAAKALTAEGAAPGSSIHSWRCEYSDRYGECGCVHETAGIILAAADECDRVAGRVTIDTRGEGVLSAAAEFIYDLWPRNDLARGDAREVARDLLAALAAAGAQPPPEGDQR